jgi:hypothetical protein
MSLSEPLLCSQIIQRQLQDVDGAVINNSPPGKLPRARPAAECVRSKPSIRETHQLAAIAADTRGPVKSRYNFRMNFDALHSACRRNGR